MSERKTLFVDVILPVPVHQEFTYRISFEMNEYIQKGVRVVVPFGRSKFYTAIVTNVHKMFPQITQQNMLNTSSMKLLLLLEINMLFGNGLPNITWHPLEMYSMLHSQQISN